MKIEGKSNTAKKTKELIKKSFADLMAEKKEIENISVTELMQKINLNRSTFYTHYDDIYEVASEIEEELFANIFPENIIINSKDDLDNYFDMIFSYLKNNENFYRKLLHSSSPLRFMNMLNIKISQTISSILGNNSNYINGLFFTSGIVSLIIQYFHGDLKEDLDVICRFTKKTATKLFYF